MNVFSTAFMDYCVLGGMPAVVASHIRTGTFEGTLQLQRQLILDYQEDIRKYAQGLDQDVYKRQIRLRLPLGPKVVPATARTVRVMAGLLSIPIRARAIRPTVRMATRSLVC